MMPADLLPFVDDQMRGLATHDVDTHRSDRIRGTCHRRVRRLERRPAWALAVPRSLAAQALGPIGAAAAGALYLAGSIQQAVHLLLD